MRDVRFVLVRPASGGNIGAVARALKNTGFASPWLVAPAAYDAADARRMAHGAIDLLDTARVVPTLRAAVADCRWVVGTSRRTGRRRSSALAPREWAATAVTATERRPLAIVFGPEADGLASAELALCQDVVCIPASAVQPSYNLAQAVLVLAYELFVARCEAQTQARVAARRPADAETLEQMYAHLEVALLAVGFVRPDTAASKTLALRRILGRAGLRPGDVRLVRGICRQILWAMRNPERQPERGRDGLRGTPAAAKSSQNVRKRRRSAV